MLDNLLSNVCKYAMAGTRVYVDVTERENRVYLTMKNISRDPLNISADELMERFVRGDAARHTEGSGLGLNIAKSLMDLMGGSFTLAVDGDLFKAELSLSQTYPGGASAAPELELPETEDGKPSPIREAAQLLAPVHPHAGAALDEEKGITLRASQRRLPPGKAPLLEESLSYSISFRSRWIARFSRRETCT